MAMVMRSWMAEACDLGYLSATRNVGCDVVGAVQVVEALVNGSGCLPLGPVAWAGLR